MNNISNLIYSFVYQTPVSDVFVRLSESQSDHQHPKIIKSGIWDNTLNSIYRSFYSQAIVDDGTPVCPNEVEHIINIPREPDILPKTPCPTTIKHIVVSGGGECGFSYYSAIRDSNKSGFWEIENIETIYGTSIGSVCAIMISLLPFFNWDTYDDFMIKRPWNAIFDFNIKNILPSIKQKGIFGIKTVEDMISPLFRALDIPISITMLEYYTFTKKELHIMTVDLTNFELVDISYKTHPEWKVIDAVYCSVCLPILFIPHTINDIMYIDGGLLLNYPVCKCIENGGEPDEILGFSRVYSGSKSSTQINTLIDYIMFIIGSILSRVIIKPGRVKNQVEFVAKEPFVNIYGVYKSTAIKENRMKLFQNGSDAWRDFYTRTYPQNAEGNIIGKSSDDTNEIS